ncbi:MAG: vitamin K epoxide reductase family protein [Cyanobacteria bacterium REEB459]|nr:vitamin K epoxide reductase family protein [Cyanobacteria bacterium REEB459]
MKRRRRVQESRWIHRQSRLLLAIIAALGSLETAYLTIIKFTGAQACPTEGCEKVLASPYAMVFGLPLSLFGFLGYLTMLLLATSPWWFPGSQDQATAESVKTRTWPVMFALASAMVVFSGYLVTVMAFQIQAFCPFCVASALFSLAMFLIILCGHRWKDLGQILFIGIMVGVVTLTGVLALYAPLRGGSSSTAGGGQAGPPISSASGPAEIALAQYLKDKGISMYGAWWCPHCHEQKEAFGAQATKVLSYIECAEDGINPQTKLCRSKPEISGFPTWEINGQFYSGVQSLDKLADLSGYQGPRNFRR